MRTSGAPPRPEMIHCRTLPERCSTRLPALFEAALGRHQISSSVSKRRQSAIRRRLPARAARAPLRTSRAMCASLDLTRMRWKHGRPDVHTRRSFTPSLEQGTEPRAGFQVHVHDFEGDVFRPRVPDDDLCGEAPETSLDPNAGGSSRRNVLVAGAQTAAQAEFAHGGVVLAIGGDDGGLEFVGEPQSRIVAL